jgi:PAS domain S-box-containing protein
MTDKLPKLDQEIKRLQRENHLLKKHLEIERKQKLKLKQKFIENQNYLSSKVEEKFRFILEATPLPILISSLKTSQILYANRQASLTLKLSQEKLITLNWTDIFSDHSKAEQLLQRFNQNGSTNSYEIKCRKADNNYFEALVSIRPFKYQKSLALLTIIKDISDLKQIENERDRFFDLSLDLFCIANFEGYFLRVNSAWEKVLGYTSEELTTTQFFDFVHPEDIEITKSELKKIEQGYHTLSFENRYRCKDGTYRWLLWTSIPLREERVTYAVAHDITERKQTEEKLWQSKEELRLITDSLPVGIAYIDNQRRYRFINRTHEIWFNHTKEEVIGKYLWEVLGEDFYTQETLFLVDRVLQGEEVSFENTMTFAPRKTKNIDGRLVPDFDEKGQVKGYFCIIIDITNRKRAELKIQEQLKTIEATIDGISILKDNKLVYLNESKLKMSGYEKEDVLGKSWFIFYSYSERKRFEYEIIPFVQQHKYWRGETIAIKKDGTTFYEELSLSLLDNNTIIAVCRDVSDRKIIEESLRITEENYRSIFENSLEGIFQSTPKGYYLNVNPAMAKIHGYNSPEDMIASVKHIDHQIYVNFNIREEFKLLLEQQDKISNFEYQVYRKDGKIIWLQENTRAVRDNKGKLMYYEGIVQDITDRKRKEEILRKQIEELQISLNQNKRKQEVDSIIKSEYFQEIKANINQLKKNN